MIPGSSLRASEANLRRWVLALAVVVLPCWCVIGEVTDPDLWVHMATGRWILAHHQVPRVDPFSTTGGGRPWAVYNWLFDVLVYQLHAGWGLQGIEVYRVGMALAVTAILYRGVRERERRPTVALGLTLGAVLLIAPVMARERSWMFSIVGTLITVTGLLRVRRGARAPQLYLPVVFMIWANCHVQVIYGLFVVGVVAAVDLSERLAPPAWGLPPPGAQPRGRLWVLFGLCAAAMLITPFHIHLFTSITEYATQPRLSPWIGDRNPPHFDHWDFVAVAATAALTLVVLGKAWSEREWAGSGSLPGVDDPLLELVLMSLGLAGFLHYVRDLWLAPPFVALFLAGRLPPLGDVIAKLRPWAVGLLVAAEVATSMGLLRLVPLAIASNPESQLEQDVADFYPVAAAEEIERRHLTGPMYNHFNWGGYLIWRIPGIPVSMDGRTDLRSEDVILRSFRTWADEDTDPELDRANLVVAERHTLLTDRLERDGSFTSVYRDERFELFVRRG